MHRLYCVIGNEERYIISKRDDEDLYRIAESKVDKLLEENQLTSIEFIIRDVFDELVDSWVVEW